MAHHLLSANLTGHDSHGVIRTPRYIQWLKEGKVKAGQGITVVHETPTHATIDGNSALVTWPVDVWFNGSRTFQAVLDPWKSVSNSVLA